MVGNRSRVEVDHCPETDLSGESRSPILQDTLPRQNLFSAGFWPAQESRNTSGVNPPGSLHWINTGVYVRGRGGLLLVLHTEVQAEVSQQG